MSQYIRKLIRHEQKSYIIFLHKYRQISKNNWQIYKFNEWDTYEVWFGFLEFIRGGVEVSESICTDQIVTFDSVVSFMLSKIGDMYNT